MLKFVLVAIAAFLVSDLSFGYISPIQEPTTSTATTRTLNTTFMPNADRATWVSYSVQLGCTATLIGGQTSLVELRSDENNPPTTVRSVAGNANSVSLAIALTSVNTQTSVISYLVPPGNYVRLVSSGTCTINIVTQVEVLR